MIYIPTKSLETYLPLYRELYKKHYDLIHNELNLTNGAQKLNKGATITTCSDFEYFLITEKWQAVKKMLDRPIIESAKYKIGQQIKFIKESFTPAEASTLSFEERQHLTTKNKEVIGTIIAIKTSGIGNGELLYEVEKLIPECIEINPYALESNILELIK
jgi:hypothetical protein